MVTSWAQLLRVQPRGGGWIGWFLVYAVVHAVIDIGGLTVLGRFGAPAGLAYGAVAAVLLGGFCAAQAATVLGRWLRARWP